jgi:GntR family transcriptional regulator
MMNIIISNTSGKPIYQQLFDQISSQIIRGELAPDSSLPPIRTVAKELRISVITVKKAWEELERQGFINSVVGRGCFVADLSSGDITGIRDAMIDKKMAKDVAYYKQLGLPLDDIIARIKRHYSG